MGAETETDDTLLASSDSVPMSASGAVPGKRVGRFVVLERLGHGAMGVVVAAYDPDLDRKVAVKLLKNRAWGGKVLLSARDRLVREARAMARLSHPNVLTVHEAGSVGDDVFIATELAEGGTLREWLAERPRPWREIVDELVPAGRGLHAAHEASLVHRDFKPDNVLLALDGRVQVADFGLVGTAAVAAEPAPDDDGALTLPGEQSLSQTLTVDGTLLGTPGYMAPEQHLRKKAGPAADQFAFCVTLYEALYGSKPFAGDVYRDLARNVVAGRVRPPPDKTEVPVWVRDIVMRGLLPDPDDRWPSMRALLDALESDPVARRRRRLRQWAAGLGVAALAGLAAFGLLGGGEPDPCAGAGRKLAGVWDDARRAEMRGAFERSSRPYATDTFGRAAARLERYAASWTDERTDACRATYERHEQSEQALDLRMQCLDRRLAELDALVELLADADAELVDRSVEAIARLTPPNACADADALRAIAPLPVEPGAADRVAELRGRLAAIKAESDAGRSPAVLERARAAAADAAGTSYDPIAAEAEYRRGLVADGAGKPAEAETAYRDAVVAAERAGDRRLAADALLGWIGTIAARETRSSELDLLLPLAEAAVARAGGGIREASLLERRGLLLVARGEYDEARPLLERALAMRRELEGRDHPNVAQSLSHLGELNFRAGDYEQSLEHHRQALELSEAALGDEHPDVIVHLHGVATVLHHLGRYDEAKAMLERALAIRQQVLGADHPDAADSLNNLGLVARRHGRHDEALDYLQRALAIRRKVYGDDHRRVADTLSNIGLVHEAQAEYAEALDYYERAIAIREKALGPDHPDVAAAVDNEANALESLGRYDDALASYRRALAIRESTLDPNHPALATTLNNLGVFYFGRGRHREALDHYERALAIREKALGPDHADVGVTLNNLGGVLHALGRDEQALVAMKRALAIDEASLGADHVYVGEDLTGIAEILLALGRPTDAVDAAERALAIREAKDKDPGGVAKARFVLAQALWKTGGARPRAVELAEQAEQGFTAAGPSRTKDVAATRAWLERRR